MAIDQTFVPKQGTIPADWLNNVNDTVNYHQPAATTPLAGTELVAIQQGGVSKQVPVSEIAGSGVVDATNVTYTPPGTAVPAPATTAQIYLRNRVDALAGWGIKGDGTTDDNAAIQACLNANPGRIIYFPNTSSSYKSSNKIIVPPRTTIMGESRDPLGSSGTPSDPGGRTFFVFTNNAVNGFEPAIGFGGQYANYQTFESIGIQGGLNCIGWPAGTIAYKNSIYNVATSFAANAGIGIGQATEQLDIEAYQTTACKYGIYCAAVPGPQDNFVSIWIRNSEIAANEYGFRTEHTYNSVGTAFRNVFFRGSGYGAVYLNGPMQNWEFNGVYIEYTGAIFPDNYGYRTTGSMAFGSTTLTIANAGTIQNGDDITVVGAGAVGLPLGLSEGGLLVTKVVSGGGTTTLTLAAPCANPAGVSNVYVVNSIVDSFAFGPLSSGYVQIINSQLDTYRSRFGLYMPTSFGVSVVDSTIGATWDPANLASYYGSCPGPVHVSTQWKTYSGTYRGNSSAGNVGSFAGSPAIPYAQVTGNKGGGHRVKARGGGANEYDGPFSKLGFAKPGSGIFQPDVDLLTIDVDNNIEEVRQLRLTATPSAVTLTNGGSTTLADGFRYYSNVATGTIAATTVTLPANPVDTEIIHLATNGEITALTLLPNSGQTLPVNLSTPFKLAVNSRVNLFYNAGTATWAAI